jgi:hypothetical protein
MKKLVFILAATMTLSIAQSFAHDKGKKKCDGHCCKKEAKTTVKKTITTKKSA